MKMLGKDGTVNENITEKKKIKNANYPWSFFYVSYGHQPIVRFIDNFLNKWHVYSVFLEYFRHYQQCKERSLGTIFGMPFSTIIKTKHSYLSFCIKYMTNSTFYFHFMRKWTRYAPKCRCFVVEVTVVPLIEDLLNSTVRENCVGHLLF